MLTRRNALISLAALAAPPVLAAKTDPLTRAILANPIQTLDLPPGIDPFEAIHAMFPQVVEQNFARLTGAGISRLLGSLSTQELYDLGATYSGAAGSQGRLLDLFALRLSGRELGALTPYFGHGPVYEAVWRSAPLKLDQFAQYAQVDVWSGGPVAMGAGVNVGMTIPEIYLAYRTAPFGALGVQAALYETAIYAGSRVAGAYAGGYWLGEHVVAPLIQNYAPSLYDAIGGTVANIVETYYTNRSDVSLLGPIEAFYAPIFGLTSYMQGQASSTGADFSVCYAWWSWTSNGGGSSCPASGCPKVR